jgi:hypothetical protein
MEVSGWCLRGNLSVPPPKLSDMSNRDRNEPSTIEVIMRDPVGYLAAFGIEAEVVAEATLAAAA